MACDSGLLGSGEQGSEALGRAKAAVPPAVEEWMKYFGLEVQISQTAASKNKNKNTGIDDPRSILLTLKMAF